MRPGPSHTPFYLTIPFWIVAIMSALALIVMSVLPHGLNTTNTPWQGNETEIATETSPAIGEPRFGEQLDHQAPAPEKPKKHSLKKRIARQVERIKQSPAIAVSATDLLQAYEQDRAEANRTYLNRVLETEGVVADIDDVEGQATIYMVSGTGWTGKHISCALIDGNQAALKNLKLGQEITIRGINKDASGNEIALTKCVIED